MAVAAGCVPSAKMSDYAAYRFPQTAGSPVPGQLHVTFLGVSTLLFDDGETQLLTDGFVTRPGLGKTLMGRIGSDTALVRSVIHRYHLHRLKAVFCVHSHYDHAMDAPYVARFTGAQLHGSASTLNIGRGAGLPGSQLKSYRPGDTLHVGKFKVVVLTSRHTPPLSFARGKDDVGEEITTPLQQPAKLKAYKEGGSYDLWIGHGSHTIFVKASTGWVPGALDNIRADVLFLGVATLSKQDSTFRNHYYAETVGRLRPQTLVPIHWDNFFRPLRKELKPYPKLADNVRADFDFLIRKTSRDSVRFRVMMGGDEVEW